MRISKLIYIKLIFIHLLVFILNNTVTGQTLSKKEQDNLFLIHPGQERIRKIKQALARSFVNFVGNDLYLLGSLNLSKQNINDNGITSPFNYIYNTVNSNTFKSGYSAGCRVDGIYNQEHPYSLIFSINRITTGNNYLNKYTATPFLEDFTHYKADNQFTTMNVAIHYRKILPINDMNKFKFYAIAGPSLDFKISNISNDNLVGGSGKRALINADFGAEFDNNGYYIIFIHYKLGENIKHSSAQIILNRFEIGMTIKASDLF